MLNLRHFVQGWAEIIVRLNEQSGKGKLFALQYTWYIGGMRQADYHFEFYKIHFEEKLIGLPYQTWNIHKKQVKLLI